MDVLIEFILEFVFEFVFQFFGALLEGVVSFPEGAKAIFKVLLYVSLGAFFGYLSFLLWATPVWAAKPSFALSIIVLPLSVAASIVWLARWEEKKWHWEIGMSRFLYSFTFAWVFSTTRYMLLINNGG